MGELEGVNSLHLEIHKTKEIGDWMKGLNISKSME
jgi:hypothetical protein